MNELPHLNTNGTAFFNGTQWALVAQRHWNDRVPSWAFDLAVILATVTGFIGLTMFFAQS